MQHLSVKIFAQSAAALNSADAIAVFHRWIQQGASPELLIDVADYAHVPAGPGVVLMGLEASYSLDLAHDRLGLLYNRRAPSKLDGRAALRQNYESALAACRRLESEPEFKDKLRFDANEFALIWNDRLLYPNTDESWERVSPQVNGFLDEVFGHGQYGVTRHSDPRERMSIEVRYRAALQKL